MITVKIGSEEREFEGNPQWVHEQLERRRRENGCVCVRVHIHCGVIRMQLASEGCAGGDGPGRRPNEQEQELFDLWRRMQLDTSSFSSGNLVAFLKQIQRICK